MITTVYFTYVYHAIINYKCLRHIGFVMSVLTIMTFQFSIDLNLETLNFVLKITQYLCLVFVDNSVKYEDRTNLYFLMMEAF